jgi:hypothetical protein
MEYDENQSWFIDDNIRRFTKNPDSDRRTFAGRSTATSSRTCRYRA